MLALDTARVGNKVGLTLLTLTMWGLTYHGPESPQVHDHDDGDGREEHAEEHRMGRRAKKTEEGELEIVLGKKKEESNLQVVPGD